MPRALAFIVALASAGCLGNFAAMEQDPNGATDDAGAADDLARAPGDDLAMAGGDPDFATSGGATDAGGGNPDLASNCLPGTSPPNSGHHNAGQNCLPCHNGSTAAKFTLAGTLFKGASSTTPVAGAIIEVIDANNAKTKLVTSSNGNFYTSASFAFPVKTRASACPYDAPMKSLSSDGACNHCHTSGMRIHLP